MKVEDKGTMAVEKGLKLEVQGTGGLQFRGTGWMFTGWKMWFAESHVHGGSEPQHLRPTKTHTVHHSTPIPSSPLQGTICDQQHQLVSGVV